MWNSGSWKLKNWGLNRIYISKYNQKGIDLKKFSIKIIFVKKVTEVF